MFPADLRAAAALGGEMGQRLQGFDWTGHPLGEPSGWPAATRATVAAAVASKFPTVLWLGERLHLIYNDAYIPVLGDRHPAALGAAGADVWWDIWDVVGPLMDSVVTTGVATWSDDLMLMLVNDGQRQERFFTFTYSPIIGTGGQMEGVFCAVTETTERVLSERRLQALNALGAALMETKSPDGVFTSTIDVCARNEADVPFAAVYRATDSSGSGQLLYATPGASGVLPSSLTRLCGELDTDEPGFRRIGDLPSRIPRLAEQFGGRCPEQALAIPLQAAGAGRAAHVLIVGLNRYRPLDELYGGFCGLLADQVSAALAAAYSYEAERRRAEELAELDRAKTAFLTNVSHEFRTPLTLMLGPLDDVIAALDGGSGVAERLEMVRRNGRRLLRMVNSLLDFSRIEAGQSRLQPVTADLGALTAGIASSFADVCRLAGLELVLDCEPAWAEVDTGMWETIVLNLVSNAFKYTLSGSITVRLGDSQDGGIEMTVRDTGVGIPADQLPRLFERFYRSTDSPGRSAEGSGIGLALVRSLVELHGGTVGVESSPGTGATFRVQLPAARTRPAAPPGGSLPPAAAARGNAFVEEALGWLGTPSRGQNRDEPRPPQPVRPVVLVADDNADMRRHLAQVLGSRWEVITAADGMQALNLARRHRPDLLVADVMMPVLDGFGLVNAIRADPELTALPVLMLSARAGQESAGAGLAAGADNYLVKPFSTADLINQVSARLGAARRDQSRPAGAGAAGHRDRALGELATALGSAQSIDEVLLALVASPVCSQGATVAAIGLLDEARGQLRIRYRGDIPAEAADRYHLVEMSAPIPMVDVVRADQPMVIPDTIELGPRYQTVAAHTPALMRAAVIEPMRSGDGAVLGAVALGWSHPRAFNRADLDVIQRTAVMLSRAVARIITAQREHEIAMALQERLLELPARSTAAVVSAVYRPAGKAMRVGGDWYTATPLAGQRIGISAGDVVGHGLPAAAVMSQLRSALGTAALAAADPGGVLDLLDRYARNLPNAAFATAAYAVIDAAHHSIDYACAGHPYPLVVTADGGVCYLREGRRPPLASMSVGRPASSGHSALGPGSLVVLYTDGLIERRSEPLDAGFARLSTAAADCARLPVGAACARIVDHMTAGLDLTDDLALIAIRPAGSSPGSHVDPIRASLYELPAARNRLRAWLAGLDLSEQQRYHILLGVGEALTNAIEHGSELDEDRIVSTEAFTHQHVLSVTVTDSGRWAKDPDASSRAKRGRGLKLIHSLSDDVQIVRSAYGTRVTMTYGLNTREKHGSP